MCLNGSRKKVLKLHINWPLTVKKKKTLIRYVIKNFPIKFFCKLKKNLIWGLMLYNYLLVSAIQCKSAITINTPSHFSLPPNPKSTLLGSYRVPGWASCVIQQLPTSYLFYTLVYICQCYSLNRPTLSKSHYVPKSILCICISIPILQIGSSVPFF